MQRQRGVPAGVLQVSAAWTSQPCRCSAVFGGICSAVAHLLFNDCRCSPGFYGHDCAKMSSNHLPAMPRAAPAAHLQDHINIPAARWHAHSTETPPPPSLRPLIYVYDLPAQYNSRMLQYRWGCPLFSPAVVLHQASAALGHHRASCCWLMRCGAVQDPWDVMRVQTLQRAQPQLFQCVHLCS